MPLGLGLEIVLGCRGSRRVLLGSEETWMGLTEEFIPSSYPQRMELWSPSYCTPPHPGSRGYGVLVLEGLRRP